MTDRPPFVSNMRISDGLVEMLARVQAIYDHLARHMDLAEVDRNPKPEPDLQLCARLIFERLEAIEDALDADACACTPGKPCFEHAEVTS